MNIIHKKRRQDGLTGKAVTASKLFVAELCLKRKSC